MKTILFTTVLAALVFGAGAFAQDAQGEAGHDGRRQKLLKKFDADGDGQLNDAEKQALREAIAAHRRGKRGDEKGEASEAGRGKRLCRLLKHFDTDGDGKLSDEEKQAAREKLREFRQKHQGRREGFEHGRRHLPEAAPQDAPASGASETPVQF